MITVHCVDTSGSMSNSQLDRARQEVIKRFKLGDIVVLFDVDYQVITDLDRPFNTYPLGPGMRGGTDAERVLSFAHSKRNATNILYSDGCLLQEQLDAFDDFVQIK